MSTNTLSYVDYDFNSIVAQLEERLAALETWQDIYQSSTGQMLIQFMAYVLQLGMFYTERRAEESFLLTAKNKTSVVNLVQLLGYSPARKTSSTGVLTFSVASPATKLILLPKYTECQTTSGVKFVTNEAATIEVGGSDVNVNAIQGEISTLTVVSDGSADQEYNIDSDSVENSANTSNPTLVVTIDGDIWTKVTSFINSDNSDKHYRVINEPDETVTIVFGDNVNGFIPPDESVITIRYLLSDGLSGNVSSAAQITTVNDTVYDADGSAVTILVTHTGLFLGGDDAEDIEEIRYEAPRVFATGDRAVSKNDFMALLENYSGVANANVWGENEEAAAAGVSVDYEMLNKVKICVLLQDWETADDDFKEVLSDYLYDISMITVKYEFIDPEILYVIPRFTLVKVVQGNSLTQTTSDIEGAVEDEFILGDTTKLGTVVKYSNILGAVDDLNAVSYANMVLEIKKTLTNTYNSLYDFGELLEAVEVLPESARLFLDGTYICTDVDGGAGAGTFTATGVSGTINYVTGEVLITAGAYATAYILYQQNEDGNIVPDFDQVCKLEDVTIDSISVES